MQGGPTRDIVPSQTSSTDVGRRLGNIAPTRLSPASPAKGWLQQPEPAVRQQPSLAVAAQPAGSTSTDTLQPFSAPEDPAPPSQPLQEPHIVAARAALEPTSEADATPTSARDVGATRSMVGGSSSTPLQRRHLGAQSAAALAGAGQNTSGTSLTAASLEAGQEALPAGPAAAPLRGRQDALVPEAVVNQEASPAGLTAAPLAVLWDFPSDGTPAPLLAARHGASGATAAAASPRLPQASVLVPGAGLRSLQKSAGSMESGGSGGVMQQQGADIETGLLPRGSPGPPPVSSPAGTAAPACVPQPD